MQSLILWSIRHLEFYLSFVEKSYLKSLFKEVFI